MSWGGARKGAGKPKGMLASRTLQAQVQRQYVIDAFEKAIKPITDKAIEQAIEGDKAAREWLSNRSWGMPKQTTDMNIREMIPFDDVDEKDNSIQEDKES